MMRRNNSKQAFEDACVYIPGGVNSPVRAFLSVEEVPVFVDHANGSKLTDIDQNTYIDYICSWGPLILGHNSNILKNAMLEAIEKGTTFGLPTTAESTLASMIVDAYPGIDMIRMVNSGTEATMSAIRVARGFTGRDKIIKFEGCYHGHNDSLLVKSGSGALTFGVPTGPGVPSDIVKNTLVAIYNDIQSVKKLIHANKDEIAAVIIEPIAGNMGLIEAQPEFLKELRTICSEEDIILIFDEVISGFRIAYQGAAKYFDITPDMVCFGKIIGGGLPVGAYGGRKDIMNLVSPSGPVYQAGTLSGNPLAMHMGIAQLSYLRDHPEIYEELNNKGNYLKQGIQQILNKLKLPYRVHQSGSLLCLFFTKKEVLNYQDVMSSESDLFQRYFHSLMKQGILIAPSPYEVMFVSYAHTMEDLDNTLIAIERALMESHGLSL